MNSKNVSGENIPGEIYFTENDFTGPPKEVKKFLEKNKKRKKRKENIESISFGVPGYPCDPNHFVANEETLFINEQCIVFYFETTVFDSTFNNSFE